MDSITYLPSPVDSEEIEMITVISNHSKFTLSKAKELKAKQSPKYDQYDHANIRDAREYLLTSVDESLETQLYQNCE